MKKWIHDSALIVFIKQFIRYAHKALGQTKKWAYIWSRSKLFIL